MHKQLTRIIRAVRRRLLWLSFCRLFLSVFGWTMIALCLYVIATRLLPGLWPLARIAPWAAALGGLWLIAGLWVRRVGLFDAAVHADQTLGIKERLSTALTLGEPDGEPEQAVLEDALAWARRIRPGQAFSADLTRETRLALVPILVLALVWWLMPQYDLMARQEEGKKQAAVAMQTRKQAASQLEQLAKDINSPGKITKPASVERIERELNMLARNLAEQKITQQQAMARMEKLKDRMRQRRADLEKQLAKPNNLNTKGAGKFTRDIQKAVKRGDFDKAASLMDKLAEKIKRGELSEADKAAMQKELKMMAEKLGMDTPLGDALNKACDKMGNGQFNEALADMEMSADQLRDLQAMLAELKTLESLDYDMDARNLAKACKMCKACDNPSSCTGCAACLGTLAGRRPWAEGDSRNQSAGMGGPGIGQGSIADKEAGATALQKSRIQGQIKPGKIIARMKVPGSQAPGEITTSYEALRLEYSQRAEDTISKEVMPLEYKARVRDYFNAIKYAEEETANQNAPGE